MTLHKSIITTPVGEMVVISAADGLLAFINSCRADFNRIITRICVGKNVIHGDNEHIIQLRKELDEYFCKKRKIFDVKLIITGTLFQKQAWRTLCDIPFGVTITYKEQAERAGSPNGFRAVGRANGRNIFEILIPCHRVVAKNGALGGFVSGIDRKQFLLEHEK